MVDLLRDRKAWAAIALAGATMAPMPSRAADLLSPPPIESIDEERVTFGTGWYLRGDMAAAHDNKVALGNVILPTQNQFFNAWSIGGGAGYKYNEWVRSDVTLDWRKPQSSLGYTTTNLHVLFNGYVDLGTWYGLTPYVGAGVGFNSQWQKFGANGYVPTLYDAFNGGSYGAYWSGTGRTKRVQFAYAAMGGLAYAFTRHVSVDLGYRFLNLGQATTFNTLYGLQNKNLLAQEVRLGLRYTPD